MPIALTALADTYRDAGVPGLEALLERTPPTRAWLARLVAALADLRYAVPASWLVRAYLERGVELDEPATKELVRALCAVEPADARLHLCQLVGRLEVPTRWAERLARFLRANVEGEHKLCRAWGVDGLVRLAEQHARYRDEALAALERAARDPAASVRARARRIAAERGFEPS